MEASPGESGPNRLLNLIFATSTPESVREGSGTHVGITVLAAALREKGHRVTLLSSGDGPRPLGITAQRLAFNAVLPWKIAAVRHPVDLVVGFDLDGFTLNRLGPPVAAPRVAAIKGVIADELTFERGIVRRTLQVQAMVERIHVRRAALVLCTSQFARARLAHHYGIARERIVVVPELIDVPRWQAALSSTTVVPSAPGRSTVLCVAHLYPRKDVRTLLFAVRQLASWLPGLELRIVGTGPEEATLQALAGRLGLRGQVSFLGHVPFDDLIREYRACDVFCLPSRQEGFGIVFLEAMAAGKPVLACRAAAVPEVVRDGETGLLVEPGNPVALAAALYRLIEQPALRARLGHGGARAVQRYAAPRVAAEFLSVLRHLA